MAGSVPIVLDKERQLRLDINALADADEVAGKAVNEFLSGERVGLSALRALLWAGLKGDDPRLTLTQAGALIDTDRLPELISAIREAIVASGIGGNGKKNGTPPAKPSPSDNG